MAQTAALLRPFGFSMDSESDAEGLLAPARAARNVALLLGCVCLLAVALLSRGRQELLGGGELLELVEGCFEQGKGLIHDACWKMC